MIEGDEVVVIIGVGQIGSTIARRQGPGRTVVLADLDEVRLRAVADTLHDDGYLTLTHRVDVTSRESMTDLAEESADLGRVIQVVHAAGVSRERASVTEILAVELQGVGVMLEAFGGVVARSGAGVVISSMAQHPAPPLTPAQEQSIADCWAEELLSLPCTDPNRIADRQTAFATANRAVQALIRAAGLRWGVRGARINSVSAGIISSPRTRQQFLSAGSSMIRTYVEQCGSGRLGTPDDIASAAAFLLSPAASFVTGTDLLVDGGVVAAMRSGQLQLEADFMSD